MLNIQFNSNYIKLVLLISFSFTCYKLAGQELSQSLVRTFVPQDFEITTWNELEIYCNLLLEEEITNLKDLESWLIKMNELDAIVQEELAWRYIRMTCNTHDQVLVNNYQYFVREIMPYLSVFENQVNRKLVSCPYFNQLNSISYYTYTRSLKRDIKLFREENIPLMTEMQTVSQQYGALTGTMSIEYMGKTYSFGQAGRFLERQARDTREQVWKKIHEARMKNKVKLENIFEELVRLRTQIAQNAGFECYTNFKHQSLGRFDYTVEDVRKFHESIEKIVTPIYVKLMKERKQTLGVQKLRPWDLSVNITKTDAFIPPKNTEELINWGIEVLEEIDPKFGEMIQLMDERGYLDLDSRVGKAPGGYNYPLMESRIPFIFMNSFNTTNDIITFMHESGHAVHSFLSNGITLNVQKRTPSEIAEFASMSMELLAIEKYYQMHNKDSKSQSLRKAQLYRTLIILPWIATVDAFQHWVYDNPQASISQRNTEWKRLYHRFHGNIVDWSGYEDILEILWHKQGHIFDVPFYYIEYAIAQVGALELWKNYRESPQQAINAYKKALSMGYTRPLTEIFQGAGVSLDFSKKRLKNVMKHAYTIYKQPN